MQSNLAPSTILLTILGFAPAATATPQSVLASHPAPHPPRDAGTLDWATGTWSRNGSAPEAGALVVFDNTCSWTGGLRYADVLDCWQLYDEGRLPSASLGPFGNLPGVHDCQVLSGFRFAYCTDEPSPIPVQIGFVQGLSSSGIGGTCVGQPLGNQLPSPPLPPQSFGSPDDLYIDLAGAGLPGSPAPPQVSCWTVTIDLSTVPNTGYSGFPFRADGECFWDAAPSFPETDFDRFNWTFEMKGLSSIHPNASGPLLAGEPLAAPPGAGTYGQPPGVDPLTGNPCGTGLDTFDQFWLNIDGQPLGSPAALQGCPTKPGGSTLPAGTNCYFFGGYPGNPFSSYHLRLWASGQDCTDTQCQPSVANPFVYCSSKVTCVPCKPGIVTRGEPSVAAQGFEVQSVGTDSAIPGLLFYGQSGPANLPFLGGILCVLPPLQRTPVQFSGGLGQGTCTGVFRFDFFPWFQSGIDPAFQIGSVVNAQYWYREPPCQPGPGGGRGLSNAVQFTWTP